VINAFRDIMRAAVVLVAGTILLPAHAQATLFTVRVAGSFTTEFGGSPTGPFPFTAAFNVDTNTAPVETETAQGLTVTRYASAAISDVSGSVIPIDTPPGNAITPITPPFIPGQPASGVYFSAPLAAGTSPQIAAEFFQTFVPPGLPPYFGYVTLGTIQSTAETASFTDFAEEYQGDGGLVGVLYGNIDTVQVSVDAPEPGSISILLAGLAIMGMFLRCTVPGKLKAGTKG
jgi:hypothetical protein